MTEGYSVPPGPSILDRLWEELLEATGEAIDSKRRADTLGEVGEAGLLAVEAAVYRAAEAKGRCLGLAQAIAIVLNPYQPDIDEVRREAMRRYREGKS